MNDDFPDWVYRLAGPLYGLVLLWLIIAWCAAITGWPFHFGSTEPASVAGSLTDGL